MLDPILRFIPSEGWIAKYIKWTDGSEPPARFRFATALGILAAILNRKVFMPFENRGTYPNLWVLLMGPSGCGKDSAISQGYELFMKLEYRPKVIAEKITPEALVKTLASVRPHGTNINRDNKGVVFAPELSTFLGRTRYNEGMITLLTRLYDCPTVFPTETITRHNITLHNVCVNMLWGSTPDWYVRYMPDGAMCGGFMSRIFYVFYLHREKRISNPKPFDKIQEDRLLEELADIGKMQGPMKFDDKAEKYFDEWYNALPDPGDNETISGYTLRKPITVKKLCMLLCASEDRRKTILLRHVTDAIALTNLIGEQLEIESSKMGSTSAAQLTDYVAHVISLKPDGMSRREVAQRTYRKLEGRRDELDRIIDWLLQLDRVTMFRNEKGTIFYQVVKKGVLE